MHAQTKEGERDWKRTVYMYVHFSHRRVSLRHFFYPYFWGESSYNLFVVGHYWYDCIACILTTIMSRVNSLNWTFVRGTQSFSLVGNYINMHPYSNHLGVLDHTVAFLNHVARYIQKLQPRDSFEYLARCTQMYDKRETRL